MKRFFLMLIAACCLSLPTSFACDEQVDFEQLNLDEARNKAGIHDQLFFLYFSADWCLPCQWMEENTFGNSELSTYVNSHYIPVKVDMDKQGSTYLKAKLDVSKIPSILVFSAAGVLLERKESTMTAEEMLRWLRALNIPAHHIRQQQQQQRQPVFAQSNAMDAPQPVLGFSRPALIPEETAKPAYSYNPVPTQSVRASPSLTLHPQSSSFTPRSGQQYGVALGPDTYTYAQGIQAAQQLEQKLEAPANLLPVDNQRFRIIVGKFDTTSEARKFLIFLNRNDLIGEVMPVN